MSRLEKMNDRVAIALCGLLVVTGGVHLIEGRYMMAANNACWLWFVMETLSLLTQVRELGGET